MKKENVKVTTITNDIVKVKINMWTGLYTIIFENNQFLQTTNPSEYVPILNEFFKMAKTHISGLELIFERKDK